MIFTSYEFIFVFLPVVFAGYWLLGLTKYKSLAKIWLILGSLYFFSRGSRWFIPWFLLTIALNYAIGLQLSKNVKTRAGKVWLIVGLVWNIGLLCFYKYLNFGIENVNRFFALEIPSLNIVLPLGISFFTFQIISYLVDSYDGTVKEARLIDYLLFITFFPKIIIGPIVRYKDIVPQFNKPETFSFKFANIRKGLFVFSLGCAKKVWIANTLLYFSQYVFSHINASTPLELLAGLFANLFAFYFDFSGYVDMAIGVGYFFNIKLPENFNMPYRARNIQDFWKRWHITLSGFLNRYVFGKIYNPAKGLGSFCLASMITFFISGLWHGAGYTYILWGLMHGVAMCIVGAIAVYYPKKHLLPKKLAQTMTFVFLLFAASLYACANIGEFLSLFRGLARFVNYFRFWSPEVLEGIKLFFLDNAFVLLMLILAALITFFAKTTKEYADKCLNSRWYVILTTVLLTISAFKLGTTSTFLYFAF